MLSYNQETLDLLDSGRIKVMGLAKFELGSGPYGFCRGYRPFTWNGLTYQPGSVIKISGLSSGMGQAARQFTITLAASKNDELTPEILKTIENEDYRDRPVTIYDAHFHPETHAFLQAKAIRRGYIDVIEQLKDTQGFVLVGSCEDRALDYTRTNGRVRNSDDQKRRVDSLGITDKIFEYCSRRGNELVAWGMNDDN